MEEILSWDQLCQIVEDIDKNFRFPAVEGLMPANPHRWGAFAAGAAAAAPKNFTNFLNLPFRFFFHFRYLIVNYSSSIPHRFELKLANLNNW